MAAVGDLNGASTADSIDPFTDELEKSIFMMIPEGHLLS